MSRRTHEEIRQEFERLGYADACEIIEQLLGEVEELLEREDELEQALADLNAFDAPVELQRERSLSRSLREQAEAWKAAAEAAMNSADTRNWDCFAKAYSAARKLEGNTNE